MQLSSARIAIATISLSLVMTSWPGGVTATRPAYALDVGTANRPRSEAAKNASYADGDYTETGQYGGQPSSITVTVTLRDGVIRAVKVTPHATNPTSLGLQRRFAAAVPAVVVGKRIDEVKVGRLAGSSGTPDGFNTALQRIREKALK